jgi:hypothetical protein
MPYKESGRTQSNFSDPFLWGIFILYLLLSGFSIFNHEMWVDELHSWNIAKGSDSFSALLSNIRYEGHPPVWYSLLWILSKFTHNLFYVQLLHIVIAQLTILVILFYAPFQRLTKILLPFGYYFLYEYAALSRNYAIALLFIFCLCIIIHRHFKYKTIAYYSLLLFASNTHLLGLLLAVSFHIYFLMTEYKQNGNKRIIMLHSLGAAVIFLTAAYFIIPPADSELNMSFFRNNWSFHQVTAAVQLPIRAFIPIPAWWDYNLWNTEVLLAAKNKYSLLRYINPIIALMILWAVFIVLRKATRSLLLFTVNLLLSIMVSISVFPLTSERYSGFIFIGFIVAYWLSFSECIPAKRSQYLVNSLLAVQVMAASVMLTKDICLPFSNGYRIKELLNKVPTNEKMVTDYWTMNIISAYADKPAYCIDLQKEKTFLIWGPEMKELLQQPNRYVDGLNKYFNKEKVGKLFMISTRSLQQLKEVDSLLSTAFQINLIDKKEGAIEKGSNLYLYEIKPFSP